MEKSIFAKTSVLQWIRVLTKSYRNCFFPLHSLCAHFTSLMFMNANLKLIRLDLRTALTATASKNEWCSRSFYNIDLSLFLNASSNWPNNLNRPSKASLGSTILYINSFQLMFIISFANKPVVLTTVIISPFKMYTSFQKSLSLLTLFRQCRPHMCSSEQTVSLRSRTTQI
jgi:hypothetical protein